MKEEWKLEIITNANKRHTDMPCVPSRMRHIRHPTNMRHATTYILTRARRGYGGSGVPTRYTHKWDGLHTRHLLESTHTNTHKHTQTHTNTHKHTTRPDKVGAGSRRGGASSSEEGACSTPLPASCIFFCRDPPRRCRALSHAEAVHGHRKSLCLQHICTFISK